MEMNEESILAWNIIEKTSANLFLTGKAGTGKTTFLKQLKEKSPKRMVVLAPTGIAAINAGGMTIHSFFHETGHICQRYLLTDEIFATVGTNLIGNLQHDKDDHNCQNRKQRT